MTATSLGRGGAEASRTIYAFRRNLVVAASAGTGKTHALVGVAVHLLLGACEGMDGGLRPPLRPDALVATTFSRKAAAEIRTRLADELESLASDGARAAYRRGLDEARVRAGLPAFADAELAVLARRAKEGLGRAKIGTLHSFAVSVVRAHALVLGLSPDFDIPDEEATRARLTEVIERVLEERAADEDVLALIQLGGGVEAFVDVTRRLLVSTAEDGRTARDLELADGESLLVDRLFHQLLDHVRDLVEEPKLGEHARAVLLAHDAGNPSALEEAMGGLWSVSKGGKQSPAASAFFEHRDALAHASSGTRLREHGRAFVRRWLVKDRLLPRAVAMKGLLVACEQRIAEANATDSVLGFADILRAARDVLRDHPDVAEQTGAQLGALLVDEFQDTSALQRDLVLLLWEKHGAGPRRAAGTLPSVESLRGEGLLVVGDRKQSIYGFRGADVAVFAELSVGLAGAEARRALAIPPDLVREPAEPSADFVALRHNRRGEAELLEFANALSRISLVPAGPTAELHEVSYVSATEDLLPPPSPAPPELVPTPRTRWLRLPVPPRKATTSPFGEAEAMSARIAAIVRGGELTVRGAPARWRDIAILAPRHEVLAASAHALAGAGIPHVVAGMGFFGAREVRDVVAMLGCLVDPDDSLARAEVLRGPWAGVTDRTLVGLTDKHAGLADASRWGVGERRLLIDGGDREAVLALARVILTLRPVIGRIGPGKALREAARALAFEETLLLLPRGEQRVANVRKLFAIADRAVDGTELLRRLRRADAREQREGEAATFSDEDDAVRLLTVHASKGLAFPIVFLPDAGAALSHRGSDPVIVRPGASGTPARLVMRAVDALGTVHDTPSYTAAKQELARREAAERRRLRYVATTRASSAMFFVGDRAPSKGSHDLYATSTAALLVRLSSDEPTRIAARLEVETEPRPLVARDDLVPTSPAPTPHRRLPVVATEGPITIHAGAIDDAVHCVRRYQLAPDRPAPEARPLGEVVASLASAGEWGARVARDRPRLASGETVVFAAPAGSGSSILVVAVIGVRVSWSDGTDDLICVDERPLDDRGLELSASLLFHGAQATAAPDTELRVGVLSPSGAAPADEPRWVTPLDLATTHAAVREVTQRILSRPAGELAPRVPEPICRATRCRHAEGCYPRARDAAALEAASRKQTAFDFFEAELRVAPHRRPPARARPRARGRKEPR